MYMPTTKKRINISLSPDLERAVSKYAKRDSVPEATKALELIKIALEIEEDFVFDQIATERMKEGGKLISHDKAWN